MAESLIERFGIKRDVVALVGAGGKTTLAFAMAEEVRRSGGKAIITTTTRLAADETGGLEVVRPDIDRITAALATSGSCLVIGERDGHKATGVSPQWVDTIWRSQIADVIIVEADGARRRKVKAPGPHEPVVPAGATLVIAVMAAQAIGGVITDVAHRPGLVASIAGVGRSDWLTPEGAAKLLGSPRGGRKSVPPEARFAVAITGASGPQEPPARRVAELLAPVPVVLVPRPRSAPQS